MRVGYISELYLDKLGMKYLNTIEELVNTSVSEELDYLVVVGGISNDYKITLKFVDEIGSTLKRRGIGFRFIAGNTDFYYEESVVNKEKKFREILSLFRDNRYYLPYNPIFTRNVRIAGFETWYDYSLYRGKPKDLKDITKKRIFLYKSRDNDYITNESDYILGIDNLFDVRYSKECMGIMRNRLESAIQKHGACNTSVAVTYFLSSKIFLKDSYIKRYTGTFEGSMKFLDIMKYYHVTDNIFGRKSHIPNITYDGIRFMCSSGKVNVVNYG